MSARPSAIASRSHVRAVLVGEQDEAAVRPDPRAAAGVVQPHQRQQRERLGLVRHQGAQHAREPDRLGGQVAPDQRVAGRDGVALVEDEIERRQHGAQTGREIGVARHLVGDAGRSDLRLRAHHALGHGGLGDQERARHLGGGQAAEQPQRERDARLGCERRMAAGEDQPQALVGNRAHGLGLRDGGANERLQPRDLLGAAREAPVGADPVERPVARDGDDPRRRVVGHAVARPALERGRVRVLDRLLGTVEVAERPRQRRDRLRRLAPEQAVQVGGDGQACAAAPPALARATRPS